MRLAMVLGVGFSLIMGSASFAFESIDDLFAHHFVHEYRPHECGDNVLKFVKALDLHGFDLSEGKVVHIENRGFSVFGMVNAEKARASRFGRRDTEESNWYHHIIFMGSDGRIFDFDFGVTARPVEISDYIKEMFLDESECDDPARRLPGEFCVGRETKLNEYEWEIFDAVSVLEGGDTVKSVKKKMADALNRRL